jgi:hypothetical protein
MRSKLLCSFALLLTVQLMVPWAHVSSQPTDTDRQETVNSISSAAIRSLEMYRWSKLEDVYKLVHQATLGPGHQDVAWQDMLVYLEGEWSEIGQLENPRIGDQLVEDLGGSFVRLNMVPYLNHGGSFSSLAVALHGSLAASPDSSLMIAAWAETCDLMLAGDPTLAGHINTFASMMREDGWPAVHHSQRYANQYQPHYRVLTRAAADSLVASIQ